MTILNHLARTAQRVDMLPRAMLRKPCEVHEVQRLPMQSQRFIAAGPVA